MPGAFRPARSARPGLCCVLSPRSGFALLPACLPACVPACVLALALSVSALAPALSPAPAQAAELWRSQQRSLEFSGSLRELLSASEGIEPARTAKAFEACDTPEAFVDCPAWGTLRARDAWQSLTRLRMQFALRWSDRLSAELSYDNEWRGGMLDGLFGRAGLVEDSFLGLEDQVGDGGRYHAWVHRAYRALLRFEGERLQWTLGRQRIPFGVGRLWNPIDRFNPIGPLSLESDQSPGIDALSLRWLFSGFSSLHAVYAPGLRGADTRAALRYQAVLRNVDVGLTAGVFEEALAAGADLAGNVRDAAWRVEAVFADPHREAKTFDAPAPRRIEPFWQVVLSLDTNFDIGSGLYVLVEHLYDGNALGLGRGRAGARLPLFAAPASPHAPLGAPISADRFAGSRVVSFAPQQSGLEFGYDLVAALHGRLLLLWDWKGESAALVPSLVFSGWNNSELSVGAQFFRGERASQYGERAPLFYGLYEVFF